MQSAPIVSVILPVFDAEAFLPEAVGSILAQTFSDFELIAIDDGSTDRSAEILAEQAVSDARIRVVSRGNRGLAHTLNEGLSAARADYVAIMNADDVSLPDRLSRQVAFLNSNPRVGAVGGQARLMLADGKVGPATRLPLTPAAIRGFLKKTSPFAHPAVMMRRQDALAVGGYRPQIEPAEDLDLWLRLAERRDIANLPEVVLHYRLHAGQATASAFEAVAVASLVADVAAHMRRVGRGDPIEGRLRIDRSVAERLGISCREIAERAIKAALGRSESLLSCGAAPAIARMPLESLRGDPVSDCGRRFFNAASRWFYGRALVSEGQVLRSTAAFVTAAIGAPYFRVRIAEAACRRMALTHWD
jgi:glycosyltransferase involved in cell wall biosynthesis